MNLSDVNDALVEADYLSTGEEGVYTRDNRDGSSYNDVAIDLQDNSVSVTRYNLKTDTQLGNRQTFSLSKPADLRFFLNAIR